MGMMDLWFSGSDELGYIINSHIEDVSNETVLDVAVDLTGSPIETIFEFELGMRDDFYRIAAMFLIIWRRRREARNDYCDDQVVPNSCILYRNLLCMVLLYLINR